MKSVLIVCEAGNGNGLGHFYRSVALAQILADKYQLSILSNGSELPDSDFKLMHTKRFEEFEPLKNFDLVILDGYEFSSDFISKLTQNNIPFVEISDFESQLYPAKYWINSSVNEQTVPGLGLNYSLLRKEILEVAQTKAFEPREPNAVFIAFGGTDEQSHSLSVTEALLATGYFEKIGVLYPVKGEAFEKLKKLQSENPELAVFSNLSAPELIEVATHYSVALVSSSTIACEMIALRKIVFTVWLYENQRLLHTQLTKNMAAIELDVQKVISHPQTFTRQMMELPDQQTLFEQQKKLIDGHAAERIRNFISNCFE